MFLESDVIKLNFNDTSNKIVPNNRQLNILEMGYYNFIHFGLNTYTGKEWGDGNVDPKNFKLKQLDTDKWVQDLMSTGSKGVIITAKHHDGFCLFNSKYTDYCIRNTPYKSGQGDIVKELSESCKKFGFSSAYIYRLGTGTNPPTEQRRITIISVISLKNCAQITVIFSAFGLTVPAGREKTAKNSVMIGNVIMQPFINISPMLPFQTAALIFGG